MSAAEGVIRLGSTTLPPDPAGPTAWLAEARTGCIVLTHPHSAATAAALAAAARAQRRYVEVLFADNPASAPRWHIRSCAAPATACDRPAPPPAWLDRDLPPAGATASAGASSPRSRPCPDANNPGPAGAAPRPAAWFLDAAEALGDAALSAFPPDLTGPPLLAALERCLDAVPDHEILHQRLWAAARALQLSQIY